MMEFKFKRNKQSETPTWQEWEWGDELPKELEKWFGKIMSERLEVIFGDNGASCQAEITWKKSALYLRALIDIEEFDSFAQATFPLERLIIQECSIQEDDDRKKIAAALRKIADKISDEKTFS